MEKEKISFEEYVNKFYIKTGKEYKSKKTNKIMDLYEVSLIYKWLGKPINDL